MLSLSKLSSVLLSIIYTIIYTLYFNLYTCAEHRGALRSAAKHVEAHKPTLHSNDK